MNLDKSKGKLDELMEDKTTGSCKIANLKNQKPRVSEYLFPESQSERVISVYSASNSLETPSYHSVYLKTMVLYRIHSSLAKSNRVL